MAGQHVVERQSLNLSLGSIFQEPADEGDPHAVEGSPAPVVVDLPDNAPKDIATVSRGKPGKRLNRAKEGLLDVKTRVPNG